jgi:uncharacterized coiled-coil protein SlyX
MQALEAKRRAALEQRDNARLAEVDKQRLEVRSQVLTLREGELDLRLRDRDRTIEELNLRLRELTGALRKEQAARELLTRRLTHSAPSSSSDRAVRAVPALARHRRVRGATPTRLPDSSRKRLSSVGTSVSQV